MHRRQFKTVTSLSILSLCLVVSARLSAQEIKPKATLETGGVHSISFSQDGKTLISGCYESIKFWDVATGKNTLKITYNKQYTWGSAAFSPDGKKFATGGAFNKVKLWDTDTIANALILDLDEAPVPPKVLFSPDGKTLVSGGVCQDKISFFDVATGKSKTTIKLDAADTYPDGIIAMSFTPDNKTLITVGYPNRVKLWDVTTGKNTLLKSNSESHISSAAVCPDGKTVVTATESKIMIHEVLTGKLRAELKGHVEQVNSLVFSPDGKTIASMDSEGFIKLWDVEKSKEFATCKGDSDYLMILAFSPDGKLLASASGKTVKLWDVPKAK